MKTARLVRIEREWSDYQQAIFDAVAGIDRGKSLVVRAVAGAGKTSTLVEAARFARPGQGGVLMTAFSNVNVDDLRAQVPGTVEVRSLHSLGFALVRAALNGATVDVQKNRTNASVTDIMAPLGKRWRTLAKPFASAVKYAKNLGLTCEDARGITLCARAHLGSALTCADPAYDLPPGVIFLKLVDVIESCLRTHADLSPVIDFDDMIWLPHILKLKPAHKFEWLVVDEAQDMNLPQITLVLKSTRSAGHVLAAGDPLQGIYEFRGADRNAMDLLASKLGSVDELPLSVSYRCSRAVVEYARRFAPYMEPAPDAPKGSVSERNYQDMLAGAQPGDLILARTNLEVLRAAVDLASAGKRVAVKGRSMQQRLLKLMNHLDASSPRSLEASAIKWRNKLEAGLRDAPSTGEAISEATELAACLALLCRKCTSVTQVISTISSLFVDVPRADVLVLSTVHRAKGLGFPRVWFVRDECDADSASMNIQYVAATRAERDLVLVRSGTHKH